MPIPDFGCHANRLAKNDETTGAANCVLSVVAATDSYGRLDCRGEVRSGVVRRVASVERCLDHFAVRYTVAVFVGGKP